MTGPIFWVAAAYLGIAAVQLSSLWGHRDRRGELWAVIVLLMLGWGAATFITLGYRPLSVWKVIEAIWGPIGTALLKPKGG